MASRAASDHLKASFSGISLGDMSMLPARLYSIRDSGHTYMKINTLLTFDGKTDRA
jgi:hypothetical protein